MSHYSLDYTRYVVVECICCVSKILTVVVVKL